ncbi:MAG: putative toxin-antitoxin system toxin component, PIN family [Caldilineaceae bacterium]|nr:putative toxin-antitoxin system toxin component, PIN family [Caldilineaceae bacterium]MBP8106226.1 putative toxin-antitoxin system toxin component, PIN family [Caldilineaceae bacterium]MBP8121157.1 putative toxin-antitoxin system toxin component, PIN family [Caldilineaceae bacterium]MBP9071550.1 putative toxin-antitoxin system toxin component, PIN family [Caldilineaceae bacterium]
MRIIIDTNVVVSGLISPKGAPRRILDAWENGSFTLLYSVAIVKEIQGVLNRAWLQRRMAHVPNLIPDLLKTIIRKGELIDVSDREIETPSALRDPFDEKFLICALLGHADYLVTGDKDLLVLETIGATQIVSPTFFADVLDTI